MKRVVTASKVREAFALVKGVVKGEIEIVDDDVDHNTRDAGSPARAPQFVAQRAARGRRASVDR